MNTVQWPPPLLEEWREKVAADTSPEWLLEPFIPNDAAIWVTGQAKKANKTTFANECVRALATGRALGYFRPTITEGVNVLYVQKEGAAKKTARRWEMRAKATGYDVPPGKVYYDFRSSLKLDNPKWRDQLCQFVVQKAIKLVVFDSLAKCMTVDENSSKDMGRIFDVIDAIRNAGAAVMYLDHLHKPKDEEEDIDNEGRGSTAKAGYYDVHNAFRIREDELLVLIRRGRDDSERHFRVRWVYDDNAGTLELEMDEFNPSAPPSDAEAAQCLTLMTPGQVFKPKLLSQVWKMTLSGTERMLRYLVESGVVTQTATGYRREA